MKIFKEDAVESRLSATRKTGVKKAHLTSSTDARDFAAQFYGDDIAIYESFFIILLNRANNVQAWVKIRQEGISGTVVDPCLVAKYAIDSLCNAVIMVHNHPSGQCQPSDADIALTRKIKEGMRLFDINLLDHIILCPADDGRLLHYSFCDEGKL